MTQFARGAESMQRPRCLQENAPRKRQATNGEPHGDEERNVVFFEKLQLLAQLRRAVLDDAKYLPAPVS